MSCLGFESRRHSSAHMGVFAVKESFEWHKCQTLKFWDKSWITFLQVEEPVRKWTAEPLRKKSSTYPVNFDLENITIVDKVVITYVVYFDFEIITIATRWSHWPDLWNKMSYQGYLMALCLCIYVMALSLQVRPIEENVAESYLDFFSSSMLSMIIFFSAFQSIWTLAAADISKKDVKIMF